MQCMCRLTLSCHPAGALGLHQTDLLQGDLIMIMSTQLAATDIPIHETFPMLGTSLAAWFLAAGLRQDYHQHSAPNYDLSDTERLGWVRP